MLDAASSVHSQTRRRTIESEGRQVKKTLKQLLQSEDRKVPESSGLIVPADLRKKKNYGSIDLRDIVEPQPFIDKVFTMN